MITITKSKAKTTPTQTVPRMAKMPAGPQGRRFDAAQKQRALVLLASGVSRAHVAATIGTSTQSLRRWVAKVTDEDAMPAAPAPAQAPKATRASRAKRDDVAGAAASAKPRSPYAPADPAHGLSDIEVAGILEWKKKHPSMGAAQLRAQLKRFNGWRLSIKAIARVLRGHGYAVVHRKGRPLGPEPVRFEAPRRNALWQADFCEVRVGDERLHVLFILDDF